MEILIIIALIVAGLILFLIEVFLVPGITLAGIASACSLLYAIYYAFSDMGMQAGFVTLGIVVLGIQRHGYASGIRHAGHRGSRHHRHHRMGDALENG